MGSSRLLIFGVAMPALNALGKGVLSPRGVVLAACGVWAPYANCYLMDRKDITKCK